MFKPNKQVIARRQSTVKNNNDEASPTESELQNKETKSSQTTLERFVRNKAESALGNHVQFGPLTASCQLARDFQGSSDQSHFIFEINVGKRRVQVGPSDIKRL